MVKMLRPAVSLSPVWRKPSAKSWSTRCLRSSQGRSLCATSRAAYAASETVLSCWSRSSVIRLLRLRRSASRAARCSPRFCHPMYQRGRLPRLPQVHPRWWGAYSAGTLAAKSIRSSCFCASSGSRQAVLMAANLTASTCRVPMSYEIVGWSSKEVQAAKVAIP